MRPKATSVSVVVLLFAAVFLTASCGSSHTRLRFANMTPDESSLDLLVDSTKLSSVNFGSASAYTSIKSGSRHLQVEPSGTSTAIIDQTSSVTSGSDNTLFSLNFSSNIWSVIATDDNSA